MKISHSLTNTENKFLALTIGNFDGIHIGHQEIIKKLIQKANQYQYQPAVMTFLPHAKVFFGQNNNFLISSDKEKTDWMASHGIKLFLQIPFNQKFMQIKADDFIKMVINKLQVKYLLVGDDFHFGYRGLGDFQLLKTSCEKHNINLQHTPTIYYNKERVSSSLVRKAIHNSNFDLVETLLKRRLCYHGKVTKGEQLGRAIGFPTANIIMPKERLLPHGVFAVKVIIHGNKKIYNGMCNIGTKPTVDKNLIRQIEVHIFNFKGNLYNKRITIEPMAKIRDEQKFAKITNLATQLHKDKLAALKILLKY